MASAKKNTHQDHSAKGTIASVSIVAIVIVLMWIGVFSLYMARI
ncbi:cytochrome c oxidase subunit 2A [Gracilibacillus marinus]|jgi:hypothetical protein|uniref:Cytochrome c oxidase subunit 2A n=1 Tax=Gracilibacillus marinus TaxID=630535 RepID=A0ABV8VSF8_9BACI